MGWALLFLILTSAALLPWYIVWTLPVAWLVPKVPRLAIVGLSAALALWEIPARVSSRRVYDAIRLVTGHTITLVATGFLVWLAVDLWRRSAVGHESPRVPLSALVRRRRDSATRPRRG